MEGSIAAMAKRANTAVFLDLDGRKGGQKGAHKCAAWMMANAHKTKQVKQGHLGTPCVHQ